MHCILGEFVRVAGIRYFGSSPNGALDHLANIRREDGERHRSNVHLVVGVRAARVFGNYLCHHVDLGVALQEFANAKRHIVIPEVYDALADRTVQGGTHVHPGNHPLVNVVRERWNGLPILYPIETRHRRRKLRFLDIEIFVTNLATMNASEHRTIGERLNRG